MAPVAELTTIVETAHGLLRGATDGGVGVWRGVAYAQQPVGDLRFVAPRPVRPWSGVRDAIEHGPLPPQGRSFVGGGRDDPKMRDEACLTVTVWSPDVGGSLPVMVWIPGGAFVYGAGQLQLYNGSRLAANGNVVVVNVTYRLGVFGGSRARQSQAFLAELGVGADELKALPQRRLRRAAGQIQLESAAQTPVLAYGLTHGVDLLPQHPIEAARAGAVLRVPLIIGTNSHEASMFAWGKPPMLPTTAAGIDAFFARRAPQARDRVLAAYPGFPRRRALVDFGSDAMFGAPTWAFADAYSGDAATHVYRFDHTTWTLKALGLGATHGSEIVHIQHSYGSYLGRKLHPLGRRVQPSVGRRMQRTWLDFATDGLSEWPRYDAEFRRTLVIRSTRDVTVEDPDARRRAAWDGVY